MGLPDVALPQQDAHAAEFTCAICVALVDAPLLTKCHHVFCQNCLQQWFDTKPSCPTCNVELDPRHGAGELRLASPLAYRVLGRLRVRCPVGNCKWHGEYSELTQHMTSSESHSAAGSGTSNAASADRQASALEQAEALKQAGNAKFENRRYGDALALFTKSVALAPEVPTYRLNRAAALFNLGEYREAISECNNVLRLEPHLAKAHRRLSKAWIELGEFERAEAHLRSAVQAAGAPTALGTELKADMDAAAQLAEWQREGDAALENGNASVARTFFANLLSKTTAVRSRLSMVRAELALGLSDRALRTCADIIKADSNVIEAYVLRAKALMFATDIDQARKHLKEALRLDPDDSRAGRELKKVRRIEGHMASAKSAFNARDFGTAHAEYTAALEEAAAPKHAPLSASLYADRGATSVRLGQYDAALRDCAVAIYGQEDCKAAWVTKALALHHLGRHAEIVRELEPLLQTFGSDSQISHAYQRAKFELRRAARPDYYGLLQIPSIASAIEIKAAYKARALECHPDRLAEGDGGVEAQKEGEAKFKLLGEALEILTDPQRRKLYDEGFDKAAIEERIKAADRAAHEEPGRHHHHHGHSH